MSFSTIILFLLFSSVSLTNALQCTNICSFTRNLTTPFSIPDSCNHTILSGKCVAQIEFWYNRQEYDVNFRGDASVTIRTGDNKRSVIVKVSTDSLSSFFSYSILRTCQDTDDCARDLIENIANEMLSRQYDYSKIMNDVRSLISGPPLTPEKPNLNCFNEYNNEIPCASLTKLATCKISDEIFSDKISTKCDTEFVTGPTSLYIYQSEINDKFAQFDVYCNQSICNSRTTLQSAKDLMLKYNVTINQDGLLANSMSQLVYSIFILFFCICFSLGE